MDLTNNQILLDLIDRPAFCTENACITQLNPAARQLQLAEGMTVTQLLKEDRDSYEKFKGGCLYLNLSIAGICCSASVIRTPQCDIFTLENDTDSARLQTMALAAQQLRVPLSNVMTLMDRLLSNEATQEDLQLREQMGQMNRGLFQILRLIGNMADAQRYCNPESLRMELKNLPSLCEEIIEKAQALIGADSLRLKFTNLNEPLFTMVCTEALERAIYNLISNAAKFSPKGSTVEVKLLREKELAYLTVQDHGQGISAQVMSTVFNRYRRQPSIEDGRYGIGLGFTMVHAVAAAHGGTLLIDQPRAGGTRVTMTLAIRTEEANILRSPQIPLWDYAGGWDHGLLELSDALPASRFDGSC